MKLKTNFKFLFISFLFLITSNSFAFNNKKILQYIDYITQASTLKYNSEPLPKIVSVSPKRLMGYVYTTEELLRAEQEGQDLQGVNGIYFHKSNTLFINSDLDKNNEAQFGPTLVHELVHYLQDINGITESYKGVLKCLEAEAYDIQMLWQIENNIRPEEYKDINLLILHSFMQCESQFKNLN